MLVTFGATFFGVIASFLLWFGGQWWIRHQRDKKALGNMMREIQEEIQLNIGLLTELMHGIPRVLESGNVPVHIPHRLKLPVYQYVVSSGEIRLLTDFRKQRLIRFAAFMSESFNKFIENTEMLLAIFQFKPIDDALRLAKHRLGNLVEQAKDTRDYLQDTLNKLQQSELAEEDNMGEPKKIDLERLQTQLDRIESRLERNSKLTKGIFPYMLGVTAMGVGLGSIGLSNTAGMVIFGVGLVISIIGLYLLFRHGWFAKK